MPTLLTIVGRVDDPGFHECTDLANKIANELQSENIQVEHNALFEIEWNHFKDLKIKRFGGEAYEHSANYMVIKNEEQYVGDLNDLASLYSFDINKEPDETPNYKVIATQKYMAQVSATGNPLCYLDIKIEGEGTFRVEVILFKNIVPRTCENFRCLCTGERGESDEGVRLGYRDSVLHRIVKGGWVQGGDIIEGAGDDGCSIYGETFPDESFSVKFSDEGIVAMANDGVHSNGSQFFITLAPLPWLNERAVAFGKVLRGMSTIHHIAESEQMNERPVKECRIIGCGEVALYEESVH